jgi:hypothetical protein
MLCSRSRLGVMVNGQIGRLRTGVLMERKVVFVPKFCLQNIKPGRVLQFFVMCMDEIIRCTAIGCRPHITVKLG